MTIEPFVDDKAAKMVDELDQSVLGPYNMNYLLDPNNNQHG